MKGMRRPSPLVHWSDFDAMKGSMKPSSKRPHPVIRPMTVRPAKTAPCVMKICQPWLISVSDGM